MPPTDTQVGREMTPDQRAAYARQKFLAYIASVAKEFAAAQPLSVDAEDIQRSIDRVVLAVRAMAIAKPDLYDCTPESVGRAIALCALTGLMPGSHQPQVDLIPRNRRIKVGNNWTSIKELQWQVNWRGYTALAKRNGAQVKTVLVFKGEPFTWEEGLNADLRHTPSKTSGRIIRDRLNLDDLVGGYVVVDFRGSKDFLVTTREQILKRRSQSDAFDYWYKETPAAERADGSGTPWMDWTDEMALKTCIRNAAARDLLPLDDSGRYALELDSEQDRRQTQVIDVSPAANRPAEPAPRALTDRGGLDALEEELYDRSAARAETREEVPATKAASGRGAAAVDRAKAKASEPPKSVEPPMPTPEEIEQLVARMKANEADLGKDVEALRLRFGVDPSLSVREVCGNVSRAKVEAYAAALEEQAAGARR